MESLALSNAQLDLEQAYKNFFRNKSTKYFVSVLVDCEIEKMPILETTVGIDMGLKTFAVLSNQEAIENPKHLKKSTIKEWTFFIRHHTKSYVITK